MRRRRWWFRRKVSPTMARTVAATALVIGVVLWSGERGSLAVMALLAVGLLILLAMDEERERR